jgi:tetratricopeptide (TPR) repeat protein
MLADLQLATGKAKEAHYSFGQAIGLDALNGGEPKFILFQQRMAAATDAQMFDSLLSDANEALELFPNQATVYLFRGIAQSGKGQFAQAANTLNTGLGLAEGNKNLIAELQGQLGEAYHALNRHSESDAAFEAALEIDPKKLGVLNNYAYYLAVRGEKLDRAAELAKRINELSPNTPGVMDTYAWVKYRQGDFEGARKLLQEAYRLGGHTNPTIVEHLGDALAKLGRLPEAAEMWKQAQALPGGGSALLARKIKENRLYE